MTSREMSSEHKDALRVGREQGRIVREYLEALEANKPKRGRKRTRETVERRLAEVVATIDSAGPLDRLHLAQERMDLTDELARMNDAVDHSQLEDACVAVAAEYGARRALTPAAWREVGVEPAVLRRAGITKG
jgi:hypothetical protein